MAFYLVRLKPIIVVIEVDFSIIAMNAHQQHSDGSFGCSGAENSLPQHNNTLLFCFFV